MDKSKRNRRKHNNNWNTSQKGNSNTNEKNKPTTSVPKFHYVSHENVEAIQKKEKAIEELKKRKLVCPMCGQDIFELASAIADKTTGEPVHFDCVMAKLAESEHLGLNEKISYIGQGRFAVLYLENPRDQKRFYIKKIIEWEDKEKKAIWRDELSGLFSQIE